MSLNVVLVTSRVTYVRDNYRSAVERLLRLNATDTDIRIKALVLLQIPYTVLLKNIIGLPLIGAPQMAFALGRNWVESELNDPRVKAAERSGVPVFRCGSMNSPEAHACLKNVQPDLVLNMRTRNIYKAPVLAIPRLGCVNVHHGLLPENRGLMCDLWAWAEGRPAGFTVHWMNEKIDDGMIIERREVPTAGLKCYLDLPFRSSLIEAECLVGVLRRIHREGRTGGTPNRCDTINYTRTPVPSQIASWRRRGLKL